MSSTGSFCTAASIDLDMVYSVASFALSSVVASKVFLVAKNRNGEMSLCLTLLIISFTLLSSLFSFFFGVIKS